MFRTCKPYSLVINFAAAFPYCGGDVLSSTTTTTTTTTKMKKRRRAL